MIPVADWEAFRERLEKFPDDWALGKSRKLDREIGRVASRRGSAIDVLKFGKKLWIVAFFSAAQEDSRLSDPAYRREAAAYLTHLDNARSALIKASHAKIDHLFRALYFVPDDSTVDLAQYLSRQMIEQEFYKLNDVLGMACRQLDRYLQHNIVRPKLKKGANNSDHFMRAFIEASTLVWQEYFGSKPTPGDYVDYVSILGAAIDEFGYPRNHAQQSNDNWLKDRVRKQLFANCQWDHSETE